LSRLLIVIDQFSVNAGCDDDTDLRIMDSTDQPEELASPLSGILKVTLNSNCTII